jgi:hypothetical protein
LTLAGAPILFGAALSKYLKESGIPTESWLSASILQEKRARGGIVRATLN